MLVTKFESHCHAKTCRINILSSLNVRFYWELQEKASKHESQAHWDPWLSFTVFCLGQIVRARIDCPFVSIAAAQLICSLCWLCWYTLIISFICYDTVVDWGSSHSYVISNASGEIYETVEGNCYIIFFDICLLLGSLLYDMNMIDCLIMWL